MKSLLAALLFLRLAAPCLAEGFRAELSKLKDAKDIETVRKFIEDSYEANKDDPEYFVAAANYWWNLASGVDVSTKTAAKGDFAVVDPKTGQPVGSISSTGKSNPAIPEKGVALLKEAFDKFPRRLDIGFGLAYMQHHLEREDECLATLETLLNTATDKTAPLAWKEGKELPAPPEKFIPESMQTYTGGYYMEGTAESAVRCRRLCEKIIAAFPAHPYAYNVLAGLSEAQKDEEGAIKYLKLAQERAPDDALIALNLGNALRRRGDKGEAKVWYRKVAALKAPEDIKEEAAKALEELQHAKGAK